LVDQRIKRHRAYAFRSSLPRCNPYHYIYVPQFRPSPKRKHKSISWQSLCTAAETYDFLNIHTADRHILDIGLSILNVLCVDHKIKNKNLQFHSLCLLLFTCAFLYFKIHHCFGLHSCHLSHLTTTFCVFSAPNFSIPCIAHSWRCFVRDFGNKFSMSIYVYV
jgi:hypothetical protein